MIGTEKDTSKNPRGRKGRKKKARIRMMKWRPKETHEEEEYLDEIGYLIGSKGDLQQEKEPTKDQRTRRTTRKAIRHPHKTQCKEPRKSH